MLFLKKNYLHKLKILTCLLILTYDCGYAQAIKFGVIGDYGNAGTDEESVANLVKSWSPDLIITLGDNNYDAGSSTTIDANIGQYYHEFIFPYYGNYGGGATVNKFFPSPGNCDWGTGSLSPYLNYFTLPGNERYYDFVEGPVHFFAIDSDTNEYHGRDSNSVQAQWLKNAMYQSSSRFNVVYLHHAPYCSGLIHGSDTEMRWPFKEWGASVVLAAHEHLYERLNIDGLTYFVNGLGGNLRTLFGFPIPGSQVRYRSDYGAMQVNAFDDSMTFKFYNVSNVLIDNYKINVAKKILNMKFFIEGFYDSVLNVMTGDTGLVLLRNTMPPYQIVDSSKKFVNASGEVMFEFDKADNATGYYIVIIHRNSIETWSESAQMFRLNSLDYDFSNEASHTYGNNVKQIDPTPVRFGIFSGDINRDGVIDITDIIFIFNDANVFNSGYVATDLTGDGIVDLSDLIFSFNNSKDFVVLRRP